MDKNLRIAFEQEMQTARDLYTVQSYAESFHHLERAHILGQRFYIPHVRSHFWMLKVGWKRSDTREILGQIMRIIASVGSLLGWVPLGNTGGANVSAIRPMPVPADLQGLLSQSKQPSFATVALRVLMLGLILALGYLAIWQIRHAQGRDAADSLWRNTAIEPLSNMGATESLAVLPLVNWHAVDKGLQTEAGVAYLVRTDEQTILFDLGFNPDNLHPSPLDINMDLLDIADSDIDSIFISHMHSDHLGGSHTAVENGTLKFTPPERFHGKKIYVPSQLPTKDRLVIPLQAPAQLGNALASIGPIRRQLAIGQIDEQALAINVADKGIVLIVGCGHQTLDRILQRTQALFDAPIYGIIGDLHYPLPEGRRSAFGINLQHRFASGSGIFSPLSPPAIENDLNKIESLGLKVVSLGGHDTSDEVISAAEERFAPHYKHVQVGDWITVD